MANGAVETPQKALWRHRRRPSAGAADRVGESLGAAQRAPFGRAAVRVAAQRMMRRAIRRAGLAARTATRRTNAVPVVEDVGAAFLVRPRARALRSVPDSRRIRHPVRHRILPYCLSNLARALYYIAYIVNIAIRG